MHFKLTSMTSNKLCNSVVFQIIRRHVATTQQAVAARTTARSFLVKFIEDRRKRSQQNDIRLEPYMSKGVYTESGAIRPVNQNNYFFY